jgi:hypothetical protein
MATYEQIGGFMPDGTQFGATASLISLYGKTPIAQQTAPAVVTSVNPTVSGCAFLASVQSLAVYAASLSNILVQDLIDIGVYA